jgi:hypothetical protein
MLLWFKTNSQMSSRSLKTAYAIRSSRIRNIASSRLSARFYGLFCVNPVLLNKLPRTFNFCARTERQVICSATVLQISSQPGHALAALNGLASEQGLIHARQRGRLCSVRPKFWASRDGSARHRQHDVLPTMLCLCAGSRRHQNWRWQSDQKAGARSHTGAARNW